MAEMYGRMRAWDRDGEPMSGEATRAAQGELMASLETQHGRVRVILSPDGYFRVYLAPKHGAGVPIVEGNIDDQPRWWLPISRFSSPQSTAPVSTAPVSTAREPEGG